MPGEIAPERLPQGWSSRILGSVDELDPADWDGLTTGGRDGFFVSHGWLSGTAMVSAVEGFRDRFAVARDERGQLTAGVLLGTCRGPTTPSYDLDTLLSPSNGRLGCKPQSLVGARAGFGNHVMVRHERDLPVWAELCRTLIADSGSAAVAVPYATGPTVRLIRAAFPDAMPALSDARVVVDTGLRSYDEYLSALPGSRRQKARREQRALIASGATVEVIDDPAEIRPLWPLLAQLERRHGTNLPDEFFATYLELCTRGPLRDAAVAFVCRRDGRPVGFSLGFSYRRQLVMHAVGLDYDRIGAGAEYFNVYIHAPVRYATTTGLETVDLGTGSLRAKLQRAGRLVPLWLVLLRAPEPVRPAMLRVGEYRLLRDWEAELGAMPDIRAEVAATAIG